VLQHEGPHPAPHRHRLRHPDRPADHRYQRASRPAAPYFSAACWPSLAFDGILPSQQFFFSYGVQFFRTSGLSDPYVTQIILSTVNLVCTFPGMYIVYRFGRREVLLWGAAAMFTGQIIVGVVGRTNEGEKVAGQVLIAFSCVFIAAFASTWGPLAWVVAAESFPSRLAPKCVTLATASNWGMWVAPTYNIRHCWPVSDSSRLTSRSNTVISFVVPLITNADGANLRSLICLIWACVPSPAGLLVSPSSRRLVRWPDFCFCSHSGAIAISFAFVYLLVPESKGLSVDQIDVLYHAHIPAWRSAAWAAEHREEFNTIDTTAGNMDKRNLRLAEQAKVERAGEVKQTEMVPDSGVATPTTPYGNTPRTSAEIRA
jgi:hypothetical protein